MHQRDLNALQQAISETATLLARLERELAAAREAHRLAIIKAFDDGASRAQLMEAFGVDYKRIARVLNKAGRRERQRLAIPLRGLQRAQYDALIDKHGMTSKMARQLAESVSA